MRLELGVLHIHDARLADVTAVRDGVLLVGRDELRALLAEDDRFGDVEVELARPGERCRILQVLDVIEPRAKTSEGHADFPGAVGEQTVAGEGGTCVLRGAAVVLSDYRELREFTTSRDPHGELIDMSGPGAEAGAFGKTHNVVLLPTPAAGVSTHDYLAALKLAGLKAAAYLGRAGKGVPPDETEVFELPPLTAIPEGLRHLPKVAYVCQILTQQFAPLPGEPVLYGKQADSIVPTLVHPNEILDGALTMPLPALGVQTYHLQNHALIRELYRRHGAELTFAGVILTTAPNNAADIERVSNIAASLAKHVLGVDGAVLTKTGGGAPELTMARTAQRCERLGIRTAIALLHFGADLTDAKHGAATIFSMPEVDAVVSMGTPFMELTLPAVKRVIGRPGASAGGPPIDGEIVRTIRWIKGAQDQLGSSTLRAVRY